MKQPRLIPGQSITNKKLEELVRYYIELYFHMRYLKDERLQDMAKEENKLPSLKEEAYSLFDTSFSEILKSVGLSRARTQIYASWYSNQHTIKDFELVNAGDNAKDVKFNIRNIHLRFGPGNNDRRYRMVLLARVILICEHVFYKELWGDLIKQFPYMKPMTDEERHAKPGFVLIDPYPGAKRIVESALKSEELDKKEIWSPRLEEYDDDGELLIGQGRWHSLP